MFKSQITAASACDWPTGGDDCELSFSELSAVLGGQNQPPSADGLTDQAQKTGESWVDFFEPVVRPIVETTKLAFDTANYAGGYLRYLAEHMPSHPITDQQAAQRDAAKHEAEQHKQEEQQAEKDHLLQGDHSTTPQEVQDWLDPNGPPAPPETPYIPTNLTDAPPTHTPQIILEPLDDNDPMHHPG